jgi:hypothetical protein
MEKEEKILFELCWKKSFGLIGMLGGIYKFNTRVEHSSESVPPITSIM